MQKASLCAAFRPCVNPETVFVSPPGISPPPRSPPGSARLLEPAMGGSQPGNPLILFQTSDVLDVVPLQTLTRSYIASYTQVIYIIAIFCCFRALFFLSEMCTDFPDTLYQGAVGFGCADYTPRLCPHPLFSPNPPPDPRRDISKHSLQISGQQRTSRPCSTFTCGCMMGRSHAVTCCFKLPG